MGCRNNRRGRAITTPHELPSRRKRDWGTYGCVMMTEYLYGNCIGTVIQPLERLGNIDTTNIIFVVMPSKGSASNLNTSCPVLFPVFQLNVVEGPVHKAHRGTVFVHSRQNTYTRSWYRDEGGTIKNHATTKSNQGMGEAFR